MLKRKGVVTAFVLILTFSMLLSACGGNNNKNNNAAPSGNNKPANQTTDTNTGGSDDDSALAKALKGEFKGKTVTMFGPFVDVDEVKFNESIAAFQEKTGIKIAYEGSKEFEATISVRVNGGNAPDIADFPQPGLLKGFVADGKVVDVKTFLKDDYLKKQYNQSWLDMAMMPGSSSDVMAGVWARSSLKSLVWYPKKEFDEAGYTIPTTWDELMALTEQIKKDGDPAWTIGIESGAATGWPATDWLEDVMLRTTTPENYDKWVNGELPFTDEIVKNAVRKISEIWFNEDYVYGGRKSIATVGFGDAPKQMFTSPPNAWLHRQANFITSFFPEEMEAGVDYDWFALPSIDPQYGQPALIAGDIYAMFNDRPEVQAVMEFFTTGESIEAWIKSGGVIAPMNDVDPSWYASDLERRMADFLKNANTIRFDGSDLMPGAVGAGTFWKGMTDYVSGAIDLDKAMEEIQAGWKK